MIGRVMRGYERLTRWIVLIAPSSKTAFKEYGSNEGNVLDPALLS